MEKTFPVLHGHGASIPYWIVEEHEEQDMKNNGQSVARLAERGGLTWYELYNVLTDTPAEVRLGMPYHEDERRIDVLQLVSYVVKKREDEAKKCPISGECRKKACMWWLDFADDCAIPTIAGILADSSICKNGFNGSEEPKWSD